MKKCCFIVLGLMIILVIALWFANKQEYFKKPEPSNTNNSGVNCGPKALSSIIRYYRLQVPWDSLAKLSYTDINGTSMYDLANTAKLLGFDAIGVKTGYPGLNKLPLPSLVFVNNNHFAALMWVGQDSVLIEDEGQRNFVKREEFIKIWCGQVLALYPGRDMQSKYYRNNK